MPITTPASTRAIPVSPRQPIRMVADSATDWWQRTNAGAWTQINPGGTDTATLVWETPSTVTRRTTFDRIQIQVNTGSAPGVGDTGGIFLNLCEGPTAVQWASDAIRNEALEEPSLRPWEGEDDDPPLGVPLHMPGANRDRLGTVLCETVSEAGGPANLVASYGPGVFVDTSGKLGVRTPFTNDVRGLGPYPAVAAWYHGGLYFQHDFGKSRNLALTRVLYQGADSDVAVVRGDGRRNTYRNVSGAFVAAAGLRNTLTSSGGFFLETTPSGRLYRYDSAGKLDRVVDLRGTTAYFTYDVDNRLQKIVPITGSGALGLVPYLSYDGSGLLSRLVLEDPSVAANNRTSYFQYDGNRNLTRIIGPELCTTYFEYNNPLFVSAVTDPQGFRWYFAYDANNRVSRVVDALGKTAYFAWNTTTPLATLKDRAGKTTYFAYNAFGSPETVQNLGFVADYYGYDGEGSLTSSKNRLLNQWTYQYDALGNRISSVDPLGGKHYFAYDASDLLRRYIDPINRTTYLDFDGSRNRTKWTDPLGNTVYYEYEGSGLLRQRQDRRGAFTYFVWDAAGNVSKTNDALGQTTYFAYSSANERTAQVDPLGRISYFEHDKRGRLVKAVSPIGAASYFAFDSKCNLVQETDALLRTTDHTYDGNSNRTLTRLPAVDGVRNPTYWSYDNEERVTVQVNPRLFATYFEYDPLGRRFRQKDALFNVTYFAYTVAHQLERQVDARGSASYFTYDAAGRLIKQKDAALQETYFGFNHAHERVLTKDPLARHTYFEYDPRGWQRQTKSASGAISYLTFDVEGNRERSIDPLGKTTYFTYDLLGRLTHTKDQLLGVSYVGYDRAGQTVLRVDELGAATYMSYDLAGRSQSTRDPAGLVSYMAYDLVGNLSAQTIDQGWGWAPWGSSPWGGERATTYFAYDAINRRTATVDPYNASAYLFYDRNGNVERQRDERNFTTYFTYDRLDRRTHTKDPVHLASTYMGYDVVGNVVRSIDPQGVTAYMTYDRLNRVQFQQDGGSGLLTYHTFDAVGNRTEQHALLGAAGQRRSTYWQYDSVNRTVKQIAPDLGASYFEYDLASNQVRLVDPVGRPSYMAYDLLNRTAVRWNALLENSYLHYDARSSTIKEVDPEGRTAYMGYDPARRLFHQSNALGEFSYFFYDARGQRTHVLNPRGYSTYWRYDLLGRNTHREHALGGVSYMGYDAVGNVVLNEGPEESNFLGLYYVPVAGTSIKRVEPDGTDDATVLSGESGLGPIALDLNSPGGKLYWAGFQFVKRANLDGSGEMTIIGSGDLDTPGGITVDVNGGRIYFGDEGSGGLKSANLDGTNVQTLRTPGTVRGLAVDPAGGKVYYTASDSGQLRRMNLDGTGDALLVGSLLDPWGVALDLLNQKVYWVDRDTNNHIRKANLDGSSPTTVLSSLGGPFEVAVDPIRDRIYWTEGDTSVLKSAKLDGTGTTTVISGTVGGIALSVPVRVALSTFDGLRRATHVRDSLMNVTYMGYDSRSSMVRRVDADGRATYMAYDTAQRLERQWHKTGVAGESDTSPSYYVYNQASEVTIVDDRLAGLGVSYFDYDKVGRVTKKTTATGAVYYAYDASGIKTSLKDPDLQENVYVFDAAGRLTREQVAAGRTAYLAYDKSGLVTRRASPGNVVVAYYSYDVAGRLKQQENKFMSSANTLLSYYAFDRNANGAQTWVRNEENDNTYYEYDRLDRLTREFRLPTGTDQDYDNYYALDAVGNRYLKVNATLNQRSYYRYDTRNLLQQEWNKDAPETTYFSYDKAGRMTTQKIAGGQSSYFGYDQRNQVTAMGFAKAASPDSAQYLSYNGVGERVSLKVGTGASEDLRFAYDGRKLLVEKNAATGGTTDRRYRHNMSVLDDKGSGVELETSGGSRRYFAWAPDGTLRNFVLDFGGGEFLENAFIRDLFGVQIYAAAGIGGNSGKLQYLSPVMIDLGLTNVQINCLGANGWLAKQGVPLELAGLPGGGQDPRDLPVGLGLPTAEELALFQLFWKWAVGSAWTLLAVPIGDGTVPPVPFPPPRSAPPPLRAGVCGPDITEWFMEEVTLWTTYALRVDATIPNSELFVMLLLGPLPKHRELRVTSARNVCPAGCQTSTGEEAVTLCNRCVGVSDLGNFVYGAMGGVIGVPWALIRPGINIGGILDPVDRHLTTMPQDVASTERGWDLMTSVDGRAALAGGRAAFCQFLAGDAADWVTMQRPAGHCTACNQSIVPANAPHSTFPPRGALSPRNLPLDALFPVIQRTTTPTKLQGP